MSRQRRCGARRDPSSQGHLPVESAAPNPIASCVRWRSGWRLCSRAHSRGPSGSALHRRVCHSAAAPPRWPGCLWMSCRSAFCSESPARASSASAAAGHSDFGSRLVLWALWFVAPPLRTRCLWRTWVEVVARSCDTTVCPPLVWFGVKRVGGEVFLH